MTTAAELAAFVPAVNDLPPAREPWEQQPRETKRAYAAFAHYCQLGPGVRSVRRTVEDLNKSHATIADWSRKHAWVARAKVYDRKIAREAAAKAAEERAEAMLRHAGISKTLLEKLKAWAENLDLSTVSARDAIRMLDVAVRIERHALGIADRHELTGKDGGPLEIDAMTAEERRARLAETLDELASRAPQDALGESV